jgi:hypothetical protein
MKHTISIFILVASLGSCIARGGEWTTEMLSLRDIDSVVNQQFHLALDPAVPRDIACTLAMRTAQQQSWTARRFSSVEEIQATLISKGVEGAFFGLDGRPSIDQLAAAMGYIYGLVGEGREMSGGPSSVVKDGSDVLAIGIVSQPDQDSDWGVLHNILVRSPYTEESLTLRSMLVDRFAAARAWKIKPMVQIRAYTRNDESEHSNTKAEALTKLGFTRRLEEGTSLNKPGVVTWELVRPKVQP